MVVWDDVFDPLAGSASGQLYLFHVHGHAEDDTYLGCVHSWAMSIVSISFAQTMEHLPLYQIAMKYLRWYLPREERSPDMRD